MEKIDIAREYLATSAKVATLFGYTDGEKVYAFAIDELTAESLAMLCDINRTSEKEPRPCLKFRTTKARLHWLAENGKMFTLCTCEQFAEVKTTYATKGFKRLTRGDVFEYALEMLYGADRNEVSNLDYTKAGDLRWNGKDYQCKFNDATIVPLKRQDGSLYENMYRLCATIIVEKRSTQHENLSGYGWNNRKPL